MCHFPFHNLHPPVIETEFHMSGKQYGIYSIMEISRLMFF